MGQDYHYRQLPEEDNGTQGLSKITQPLRKEFGFKSKKWDSDDFVLRTPSSTLTSSAPTQQPPGCTAVRQSPLDLTTLRRRVSPLNI